MTFLGHPKRAITNCSSLHSKKSSAPKAWTQGNPLAQRSTTPNTANGTSAGSSKNHAALKASQNASLENSSADKHAHDRLLFLITNFTVRTSLCFRHRVHAIPCPILNTRRVVGLVWHCCPEERRTVHRCLFWILSRANRRPLHHENGQADPTYKWITVQWCEQRLGRLHWSRRRPLDRL